LGTFCFVHSIRILALGFVFLCNTAIAGQWQPLCIAGSSCESPYHVVLGGGPGGYHPIDRHAAGPLVTHAGILLHHTPVEFPVLDASTNPVRHIFQLSTSGLKNFGNRSYVSDANAIQSSTGRILSFFLGATIAWFTPEEEPKLINFYGQNPLFLDNSELIGPPVIVNNVIYTGIRGGGGSSIYMSSDDGNTWTETAANIRIGEDRFNLLANPERNALWAISSEFNEFPGSLWESTNHGATWQQVDDGSFPRWTVRIVHDPENALISYALTNHGLFISADRGTSWQATSLAGPVHGMVFIKRMPGLSRALIVGTDTGVSVSIDESTSWVNMSRGLPETAQTVTYGHGQLIATSDVGYFTCNAIDCAGLATPFHIEKTEIDTFYIPWNESIQIRWKPVAYATVYRVFRCMDANLESCALPIKFSREISFYDQDATPGVIYHYRVRACIRNRCGSFSTTDTNHIKLATPTNIKASDGTFRKHVGISWKPVDGASVYRLFRCPDGKISSCGLPISYPRETFFNDTKVISGAVYHYRVRACTTDTCSWFSAAAVGHAN